MAEFVEDAAHHQVHRLGARRAALQARGPGDTGLVAALGTADANPRGAKKTIARLQHDVLPKLDSNGTTVTLGGVGPEGRDFIKAVYGKFPYVVLFVLILTYLLLMRAFRSLVLPLKAVLLNLVSLGAAYGIVVFIFQQGHGSDLIWGVPATGSIISWIPLMIFAFLYGISMDYEVFMLTRNREEYDETGDTKQSIAHGLARTGKLVTSAAAVLMLAFFSLSTGPGPDIKQFAIGLAAGVIFDASVVRALLVHAAMALPGRGNRNFPQAPPARCAVAAHRLPGPSVARVGILPGCPTRSRPRSSHTPKASPSTRSRCRPKRAASGRRSGGH